MATKMKTAPQPPSRDNDTNEEKPASTQVASISEKFAAEMEETRPNKRRAVGATGKTPVDEKTTAARATAAAWTAFQKLSLLEKLQIDPMVHVCQYLDLPMRWCLSRCSKTLERLITKECTALWRHINFHLGGVAKDVCENVLTDEMVASFLTKVNARHVTLSLVLKSCRKMTGTCLEPLRHSRVLRRVHFDRDSRGLLNDEIVEDILRTMMPYKLVDVKLPPLDRDEIFAHRNILLRDLREASLRPKQISCKHCKTLAHQDIHSRILASEDPSTVATLSSYRHSEQVNVDSDCEASAYASEYNLCERCRNEEKTTSVRPVYMANQPALNIIMRSILVDWLVSVHDIDAGGTMAETLYLAVNLIDRYLERKEVIRAKLQLVGVTSMLIAIKHTDLYVHPPTADYMAYICAHACTKDEVSFRSAGV